VDACAIARERLNDLDQVYDGFTRVTKDNDDTIFKQTSVSYKVILMKRIRFCVSVLLSVLMLASLSGCQERYPLEEEGKQQIEIDLSEAEPCLEAYLQTKYGLTANDYTVSELAPWTLDSVLTITPGSGDGAYYSGYWQAKIDTTDETFYVRFSVSGDGTSFDTRQGEEYYSDLETWLRENLDLPDSCTLYLSADGISNIAQANGLLSFFFHTSYRALSGSYDGENVFSPVEEYLDIDIYYPDGFSDSDYVSTEELEQVFSSEKTGDITVRIGSKAPGCSWHYWGRFSSSDLANGVGESLTPTGEYGEYEWS
jgi:hypothetical protein